MNERQMLELAGEAIGLKVGYSNNFGDMSVGEPYSEGEYRWNPLTVDADAFNLALRLIGNKGFQLTLSKYGASARVGGSAWVGCESHVYGGIEKAARRAIVQAAAEIARARQEGKS